MEISEVWIAEIVLQLNYSFTDWMGITPKLVFNLKLLSYLEQLIYLYLSCLNAFNVNEMNVKYVNIAPKELVAYSQHPQKLAR